MNLDKICRLCLEEVKPLLNVYEPNSGISGKISALSSVIEMREGDGLPEQVCQHCLQQLEVCHRFISKCEQSHYTLTQYLRAEQQGAVLEQHLQGSAEQVSQDNTRSESKCVILRNLLAADSHVATEEGLVQGEVLHRLLTTAASNGVEIKAVHSTRKSPSEKTLVQHGDGAETDLKPWKVFGSDAVNLGTLYTAVALPSSNLAMLPLTRYSSLLQQQIQFDGQRVRRPSAHQKPHSNRAVIVDCYNCALRCHDKLGAQERAKIHEEFHNLEDYAAQMAYINSRVERFEPRRRKINKPSRRKISQIFTLEYGGAVHRVCKKFFLSTLDISDKKARIFLKKKTVQKTASSLLLKRDVPTSSCGIMPTHVCECLLLCKHRMTPIDGSIPKRV